MQTGMSRRIWLAAAAALCAPLATTTPVHATTPPNHVVSILQETHSFANVLGAWCVQTGRCDGATTAVLPGGTPYPLTTATDRVPDVSHDDRSQITAVDDGKMDGFSSLKGCGSTDGYRCLSQFQPSHIPN